jgi:hypothetical protein
LRNALAGFFQGDALAAIQSSQPFLHRLPEFQFVNRVNECGIRWQFFRHLQENFFRTHSFNVQSISALTASLQLFFREGQQPKLREMVLVKLVFWSFCFFTDAVRVARRGNRSKKAEIHVKDSVSRGRPRRNFHLKRRWKRNIEHSPVFAALRLGKTSNSEHRIQEMENEVLR